MKVDTIPKGRNRTTCIKRVERDPDWRWAVRISARVQNRGRQHDVMLATSGRERPLSIAPKFGGQGSSVNGGELLLLALATCYCNDLYREAARRGMRVDSVEVEVDGDFGAEGEPAVNVAYKAKVTARATAEEIRELMQHTDSVAEIQNTLRIATPVQLRAMDAVSLAP